MKYALVYNVSGCEQFYGFTERLDSEQLLRLCENAIEDEIEVFRIVIFGALDKSCGIVEDKEILIGE